MPMEVIQVKMRPTLTQHLLEEEHWTQTQGGDGHATTKAEISVLSTSQGMTRFANKYQKIEQERKELLI